MRMCQSGVVVLVVVLWLGVEMGAAQQPPPYNTYPHIHTNSQTKAGVGVGCRYPCECPGAVPECRTGVRLTRDLCGCCLVCAGQLGDTCHSAAPCDSSRNLSCTFSHHNQHSSSAATVTGICTAGVGCLVDGRLYQHGQSFNPDCRTQCTCQNGTYACVSLCPAESLLPSAPCHNPHLVPIPGRCCREWMCDAAKDKVREPVTCERSSGEWSRCSVQGCGAGVSVRWTTDPACQPTNQTRLCQVRPCQDPRRRTSGDLVHLPPPRTIHHNHHHHHHLQNQEKEDYEARHSKHHIRRGHQCKATLRSPRAVRLRAGWCVSLQRHRPKSCADCPGRCCSVHTSTTITVPFLCPLHANTDLLALPHTRSRRPQPPPTTPTPSVYDMMDEGQPMWEAVLSNPNQEDEDHSPSQHDEDHFNLKDNQLLLEHEDLTVEDDTLYEEVKSDNYETVHYQVEWILRCRCTINCNSYTRVLSSTPTTGVTTT